MTLRLKKIPDETLNTESIDGTSPDDQFLDEETLHEGDDSDTHDLETDSEEMSMYESESGIQWRLERAWFNSATS